MNEDEMRDRLAERAAMFDSDRARVIADYLLPTVRGIVADELRARAGMVQTRAAEEEDDLPDVADALDEVSSWLCARADALADTETGARA